MPNKKRAKGHKLYMKDVKKQSKKERAFVKIICMKILNYGVLENST